MAAAGDVPEVMLKMLECSVCTLNYDTQDRQAMILQCGHYFCKTCIESTAISCTSKTMRCPKCRQLEFLSQLKKNFAINEMLETLCCQCVKRVQVHSCSHCPKTFCDGCHQHHVDELTEKGKKELQEKISIAKERFKEKKMMHVEDVRKQKASDALKNDVDRIRDALDKYQKANLQQINDLSALNKLKCKMLTTSVDESIQNATALVYTLPRTQSSCHRIQMIKDYSEQTRKIDEALSEMPDIHNYQYDSNNIVDGIIKILDKVNISKSSKCASLQENVSTPSRPKNLAKEGNDPSEKPVPSSDSSSSIESADDNGAPFRGLRAAVMPVLKYRGARLDEVIGEYGTRSNQFNSPNDVAVAPNGNIYIVDKKNHRVKIYDSDLEFLNAFGRKGDYSDEFMYPFGISINSQNEVFISDNFCVKVYSATGRFKRTIGDEGQRNTLLCEPTGLTIGRDGLLYVCDNDCIMVYHQNGKYVRSFGHDVFDERPMHIAMTAENEILVSENRSPEIHIFTENGPPHLIWTPRNLPVFMESISGMIIDDSGHILLTDRFRIFTFDKDRRFQWYIQSRGQHGRRMYRGMALDCNGHLLVCDSANHNIAVFDV